MARRKGSRKKSAVKARLATIISYIVIVLLLLISMGGTGYYFGYSDGRDDAVVGYTKERNTMQKLISRLQKKMQTPAPEVTTPELSKRLHTVVKPDQKDYKKTAPHEYSTSTKKPNHPPLGPTRAIKQTTALPKLAIIIDDVSFARDVPEIKALNMPLTMSFLPPSESHPDSAKLAAKEPYYMVHLPLEAKNFSAAEPSTLHINASQQEITNRIREIKRMFPKVEYVNNHTGSTFTSDETAMNRLIFALREDKIDFIDSRTTGSTKVPDVMRNFGLPYVARDIFLDHDANVAAIKKQIKKAVNKARKHGSAIAIGHPHKETLEALSQSKKLLRSVQLVRIDELM